MARAHRWERPSPDLRSKESWQRVSPANQVLSPTAQQLDRITVLFDERYHSGLIAKAAWTTVHFINTPTFVAISLRLFRSPERRRQPCLPAALTPPSPRAVLWPGPLTLATTDGPPHFCWDPCKPPRTPSYDSYSGGCFAPRGFS